MHYSNKKLQFCFINISLFIFSYYSQISLFLFQEWILDLAAFDLDRFANHTELATLQIMMKDMKDVFINPKMQMYNIPMKPSNKVLI